MVTWLEHRVCLRHTDALVPAEPGTVFSIWYFRQLERYANNGPWSGSDRLDYVINFL